MSNILGFLLLLKYKKKPVRFNFSNAFSRLVGWIFGIISKKLVFAVILQKIGEYFCFLKAKNAF